MPTTDWRLELARARRFARRLERADALAPIPPPLPEARVLAVPGRGEVFFRDAGSPAARPIVLLHGWTASADLNWFRVYDTVASYGRLLAPDHRGHGRGIRSEERFTLEAAADDVAGLLAALGAAPAVLVGYSMGGPIALLAAQRHPAAVAGLVLQATALEWRATARERFVWRFMALVEYLMRLGRPRGLIERALREMVEDAPDLAPLVGWLRGELRRGDPEQLADAGRALGTYDFRRHAADVRVPAAVVVTTKDRLVRPNKQRQLAQALSDSATFELHGDHNAALANGDDFVSVTGDALGWVLARLAAQDERRTAG